MQSHKVMRQMPEQSGRAGERHGEAGPDTASDETRGTLHEHQGTGSAKRLAGMGGLLEAALTRQNLPLAWKRVKANKGAAGADGLDIEQTARMLKTSWPDIRQALLQGRYRPSPVRKVVIPKPDGSQRELGIPTVIDRLIQQALLQVLQPLIDRLKKRIDDAGVIRLVRAYLNAGIMDGGVVVDRHLGTPQGGPLSPLPANVLLDEVDKALDLRGYSFARYADDCNVYVGSRRAGERVMAHLRKLYTGLKLQINEAKSTVVSAFGHKFIGYAR